MHLKLIKLNVSLLGKKGNGKNTLVNLIFFLILLKILEWYFSHLILVCNELVFASQTFLIISTQMLQSIRGLKTPLSGEDAPSPKLTATFYLVSCYWFDILCSKESKLPCWAFPLPLFLILWILWAYASNFVNFIWNKGFFLLLFTYFYEFCIFEAPFSMDPDVFKDLVQKEVKRIQGELIEFAKYLRSMKVRRNWYRRPFRR